MRRDRVDPRRPWTIVALAAVALACAWPMQSVGCPQNAHYAGTRAIAAGVPYIDRWAEQTCDLVHAGGHFYAAKGPALDFWSAPWYLLLHAVGAVPHDRNVGMGYPDAMVGVPLRAIWQIGLWAVVLPALVLLLLVRRLANELEPGTGTAAAVIARARHARPAVLDAAVRARAGGDARVRGVRAALRATARPSLAGVCAGLAAATDFPFAIPAVLIGMYAWRRLPRYAAGGVVGLLPVWASGTGRSAIR